MDAVDAVDAVHAVDAEALIFEHYRKGSRLADLLLAHSRKVRDKALETAARMPDARPDLAFIEQAALLHDIGIYWTDAPRIHCLGAHPYLCHGVIGRHLLEQSGLTAHGLVCERHVGVGISQADIQERRLPLPLRDMLPLSLEEIVICYADKFFSKGNGGDELPLSAIQAELAAHGPDKVARFMAWHAQFTGEHEK